MKTSTTATLLIAGLLACDPTAFFPSCFVGSTQAVAADAQPAETQQTNAVDQRQLVERFLAAPGPAAAVELAKLGPPAAEALRQALLKPEAPGQELRRGNVQRPAALCAWAIWQNPHPAAVELLRSMLRGEDQVAGYWAARALGAIGDSSAVGDLAGLLPQKHNYYWEFSRKDKIGEILLRADAANVDAPREAPPDTPNVRVTYAALLALGEIGGPQAEATLVEAARRPLYLIRHAAVQALGTMRAEAHLKLLRTLRRDDPVLIVRHAASEAIARIESPPTHGSADSPLPPMPDTLVFIKTANRSDSNFGFRDSYPFPKTPWFHSGENLYLLSPVWPPEKQQVQNLTNLSDGAVQGPEVSYDGRRILFAMRRDARNDGFHIFEMDLNSRDLRQLTDGNCNDVDPCYLPDGRIMFSSDRAGYHEGYHQERSRALYVMEHDGTQVRQVTFNPNQDYEPLVLSNGQVVYSSYRFYGQDGSPGPVAGDRRFLQRFETTLRSIRPDGTADDLFYGAMRGLYYTPIRFAGPFQNLGKHPRGYLIGVSTSQQREMHDGRIVCVTPAGLTVLDPSFGRIDCELPVFPEILNLAGGEADYISSRDVMNPHGRYTSPHPSIPAGAVLTGVPDTTWADHWVYVSHAPWYDSQKSGYGLYLFDLATRRQVLVYDDPEVSDVDAIPIFARRLPKVLPVAEDTARLKTGRVYCVSVFNSDLPYDHASVKYVRVIAARLQGLTMNANASFRTRVLGEVPLEKDGSFYVEVPADVPLRFQLLDGSYQTVVHETEFNYIRPGETRGCLGCHEPKDASPDVRARFPLALQHPPARMHAKRGDLIYQGEPETTYGIIVRD